MILVVFFLGSQCMATQDYIFCRTEGKVTVSYIISGIQLKLEIDEKINILHEIINNYLSNYFDTSPIPNIQIVFKDLQDYNLNTNLYYLSYGEFDICKEPKSYEFPGKREYVPTKGIILTITDFYNIDIAEILKLLDYGINNNKEIQKNQKESQFFHGIYYAQTGDSLRLVSIPFDNIIEILGSDNPDIENLLSNKVFRNDSLSNFNYTRKREYDLNDITYYYQNAKYHLIRREQLNNSDTVKEQKTFKIIISFENIHEIFKTKDNNYFLFINDSTFYYYDFYNDLLHSPLTIDSAKNRLCLRENIDEVVVLEFWNEYESAKISLVYFPHNDELITYYKEYWPKDKKEIVEDKPNIPKKRNYYLLISLVINCLLILLLIISKQKRKKIDER